MNKSTLSIIIAVVGVIALIAIFFYRSGGKQVREPSGGNARSSAAGTGTVSFKDLLDEPAPEFSLADRTGVVYSSQSLRGKNVILFFNEGLMCYPACWNQIVALAKDERIKNSNTVALSVVADPAGEWQKAIDQMPELAEATVVFDADKSVSRIYGVLAMSSSMHAGSLPGHSYVVIDKEGIVRYVFDDPNMGIRNDQLIEEIIKINQAP